MPETNTDSAPDAPAGDDLTQIRGIGPKKEPRLKAAGILTYADLAQRSPEELAAASGVPAKTITEKDWIGEAERLAAAPPLRVRVEKLVPIRKKLRSYRVRSDEPAAARLMFRVMATATPTAETFDFEATIEAQEYYHREDVHVIGVESGKVAPHESCTVEVSGDPLPPALYKLVVGVNIYAGGHGADQEPLGKARASGHLLQVDDSAAAGTDQPE